MAFFTPEFAASIAPKERGAGAYLNPSSIEDGSSVRFAILSESPLTGYEVWFTKADGGQTKRIFPASPTPAQLQAACAQLGAEVTMRDGKAAIKQAIAFFVYNYETSEVA